MSLLFALGVVPASLWAGWSLFDRRTGWICAALAAVSPFLAIYGNETRMYSLAALLSLLTTAMFLHVFACRRRQLLPAFVVLLALTAYTRYWGLFLALGTAAAFCWAHGQDRRRLAMDAVVGFGAFALLMAPWVPTLLYQRAHSAVPMDAPADARAGWGRPGRPRLIAGQGPGARDLRAPSHPGSLDTG